MCGIYVTYEEAKAMTMAAVLPNANVRSENIIDTLTTSSFYDYLNILFMIYKLGMRSKHLSVLRHDLLKDRTF